MTKRNISVEFTIAIVIFCSLVFFLKMSDITIYISAVVSIIFGISISKIILQFITKRKQQEKNIMEVDI